MHTSPNIDIQHLFMFVPLSLPWVKRNYQDYCLHVTQLLLLFAAVRGSVMQQYQGHSLETRDVEIIEMFWLKLSTKFYGTQYSEQASTTASSSLKDTVMTGYSNSGSLHLNEDTCLQRSLQLGSLVILDIVKIIYHNIPLMTSLLQQHSLYMAHQTMPSCS